MCSDHFAQQIMMCPLTRSATCCCCFAMLHLNFRTNSITHLRPQISSLTQHTIPPAHATRTVHKCRTWCFSYTSRKRGLRTISQNANNLKTQETTMSQLKSTPDDHQQSSKAVKHKTGLSPSPTIYKFLCIFWVQPKAASLRFRFLTLSLSSHLAYRVVVHQGAKNKTLSSSSRAFVQPRTCLRPRRTRRISLGRHQQL